MRSVLRLFRRPSWWAFTAFAAIMVLLFVGLARWQLDRRQTQADHDRTEAAAYALAAAAPSDFLATDRAAARDVVGRAVVASGSFDAAHQVLVRNRTLDGQNGYLVVTPLETDGGDLLVVRGWIPAGRTAGAPDEVPAPPVGEVVVEGRARTGEPPRSADGMPAGQVQRIVPSEWPERTGRETYQAYVVATDVEPTVTGHDALEPWPADPNDSRWWKAPHLAYAVQWLLLAVVAVVGYLVLARREALEQERDPDRTVEG